MRARISGIRLRTNVLTCYYIRIRIIRVPFVIFSDIKCGQTGSGPISLCNSTRCIMAKYCKCAVVNSCVIVPIGYIYC